MIKPTMEQMWQDICLAKKPCSRCQGSGREPQIITVVASCVECLGIGQVWFLPGLQRQCNHHWIENDVGVGSDRKHCPICNGSGWVPIEFDALALMDALSSAGMSVNLFVAPWSKYAAISTADESFHHIIGKPKEALIKAAHEALGLEE